MGYYGTMSRKTDNIYKALDNISLLEQKLAEFNKTAMQRELDDIGFELRQQLKELKFWIDSLYLYNGKSTSNAKKNASRENGKKGGRPPKKVTEMKRRREEIENILLPDLNHRKQYAETSVEENNLSVQIEALEKELTEINYKLENNILQ